MDKHWPYKSHEFFVSLIADELNNGRMYVEHSYLYEFDEESVDKKKRRLRRLLSEVQEIVSSADIDHVTKTDVNWGSFPFSLCSDATIYKMEMLTYIFDKNGTRRPPLEYDW